MPTINDTRSDDTVNVGSDNDDILRGGASDDVLNGEAGRDILIGGRGADVLTGGAGEDAFIIGEQDGRENVITDFQIGEDAVFFEIVATQIFSKDGDDTIVESGNSAVRLVGIDAFDLFDAGFGAVTNTSDLGRFGFELV